MTLLSLAALLLCCGCASLTNHWGIPIKGERNYNDYEYAYLAIAAALASDVPCLKIARTAVITGGSRYYHVYYYVPYHVAYIRSECLMNVAALTRNSKLCAEVVSAGSWFVGDGGVNKDNCLAYAGGTRAFINPDYSFDAKTCLPQLGYDWSACEQLHKQYRYTQNEKLEWRTCAFYAEHYERDTLLRQLARLPNFQD